jgi:hypothetical protein
MQAKDIENLFNEIIAMNLFLNLVYYVDIKLHEAHRMPNRHDQKRFHYITF